MILPSLIEASGSLQVRIELPSHGAHTGALCGGYVRYLRIELLIMLHSSGLEVRESGYTAFGLSDRVCVRLCVHAFVLQTANMNNVLSHEV